LRSLLSAAATKKRSLESLKDLQFERFIEAREKMEQKSMDELVLMRSKGEGT
jgi:flagellar export protein FliJ